MTTLKLALTDSNWIFFHNDLPKPKNDELMFLPLGGSGEIGEFNLYGTGK